MPDAVFIEPEDPTSSSSVRSVAHRLGRCLDPHRLSQEHVPQPCDTILRPERSSALRPRRPHTSGPKRPVRLDSPFAADFLNHFKASEKFFFTEPSLFIRSG